MQCITTPGGCELACKPPLFTSIYNLGVTPVSLFYRVESLVELKRFGHPAGRKNQVVTLKDQNVRKLVAESLRPLLGRFTGDGIHVSLKLKLQILGYCFHPWCPDGRAGGGKKFVRAVSQKPQGVGR